MGNHVKLTDRFTIGTGQPTEETLEDLAQKGIKVVANLRTRGERNQPLDPDEEGEKVRALGMQYRHVPVPGDVLDAARVDEFREAVRPLPGPVFVHCASGMRSGAFTLMHVAAEEGWTGDEALATARKKGLPVDTPELVHAVKAYVDRH